MPERGTRHHIEGPVNINTASEDELAKVPDIGSARAQQLVEYRSEHGLFDSVDELVNVPGFSERLIDGLRLALSTDDMPEEGCD